MTSGPNSPPVLLAEEHDFAGFDCGEASLNDWLARRAIYNNESGASKTYVMCVGNLVVAYYCLAMGAVFHDDAPVSLRRNMPDPIPVLVLGRLAVDGKYQNLRLGRALLKDAVQRSLHVAETVGATAILVHAISERAQGFYKACGFLESPLNPMTLCLPMATVRKTNLKALNH